MELKNCYGVVVNPVDETPKVNSVTMELEQFLHGVINNPKDMLGFGFAFINASKINPTAYELPYFFALPNFPFDYNHGVQFN